MHRLSVGRQEEGHKRYSQSAHQLRWELVLGVAGLTRLPTAPLQQETVLDVDVQGVLVGHLYGGGEKGNWGEASFSPVAAACRPVPTSPSPAPVLTSLCRYWGSSCQMASAKMRS